MRVHTQHSACAEVREPLFGCSLFPQWVLGDELRSSGLSSKYLYPLSTLTAPEMTFNEGSASYCYRKKFQNILEG